MVTLTWESIAGGLSAPLETMCTSKQGPGVREKGELGSAAQGPDTTVPEP